MNLIWLPLAIVAYILFAASGLIDKFIVGHKMGQPVVVSFWVALLGSTTLLMPIIGLLPFDFVAPLRLQIPDPGTLSLIIGTGIILQLALLSLYTALKRGEATRVVSAMGAVTPVFALIFAYFILGETLKPLSYVAFGFLLLGAAIISAQRGGWLNANLMLAVIAAALSALQSVLVKYIYFDNPFLSSFALLALGNLLYCSALLLFAPEVRIAFRRAIPFVENRPGTIATPTSNPRGHWILINGLIGGLGVFILNLALKMGPASLVNALRGVEYVAVFAFAIMLSRHYPKFLHEELSARSVHQKLLAVGVIGTGVVLLTVVG